MRESDAPENCPSLGPTALLVFPRARVSCPQCAPEIEAVPWLDRNQPMTTRLAESIARLAHVLPLRQLDRHHAAYWRRVKQIDRGATEQRSGRMVDQLDAIAPIGDRRGRYREGPSDDLHA